MKAQTGTNIDKILIEAIQKSYSVFAWKSFNGVVEKCEMKIKAFRKEYNEIELEIVAQEKVKIANVVTGNRELNIYMPDSSVSFQVGLKKTIDERKLQIVIPAEFEFFERRKHERIQPKKGFLTFEYNKLTFKKQLFDVSLGGIAIVLPKTEKINFKKGDVIQNCVLDLNTRKIKVKMECVASIVIDRFKLESLPYGGNKLAFRFLEISQEDKDFLAQLITIEAIMNKQLKGA